MGEIHLFWLICVSIFLPFFYSYSAGSRRKVWISRRYEKAEKDIIPVLNSIRQGRYPNLDKVPAPNKYSVVKLVMYVTTFNFQNYVLLLTFPKNKP